MRSDEAIVNGESRQVFVTPNSGQSPDIFIDTGRLGSDWGWFSDPLLEIPMPIYDSTAHVRGEQNARREMRRAGR